MEKEVNLFDKRFVYFMWDDELDGKEGFFADDIGELQDFVNNGHDTYKVHANLHSDCDAGPFCAPKGSKWRFFYYDPNYNVKWAYYKEGKAIQYRRFNYYWIDDSNPNWGLDCEYQVKPDCPCEDGIDSKACAGCPQDEERRHPFRPFKDCDELVEFWSKNYQTVLRPANTKPLIWVRLKVDKRERLIVAFGTDFIEIGNKAKAVPLQKLFEDYEFLDGAVCGVKND